MTPWPFSAFKSSLDRRRPKSINQSNMYAAPTPPPAYSPMDQNPNAYHQSNHHSTHHHQTDTNNDRGLGGLIVGLGTAALVNQALNQPSHSSHSLSHTNSLMGNLSNSIRRHREDPLATLARYDTVLLIDDSLSMSQNNRWAEASLAVSGLAEALVRYDLDGIDVYFMNSLEYFLNAKSASQVQDLFQRVRPIGPSTPTDVRVQELLSRYIEKLEINKANNLPPLKPLNLIIITDGEADDPDTLAYALAGFAERLDEGRFPLNQLGVQFIQIGKDKDATRALKALDDELKSFASVKRDLVDTTPYQGRVTTDFVIKACLGGINKRIDNRK
ncbi:hypothetical protein O181_006382 [Austropuccinia psidii MF-1]|uniref:VWFA domain-containing protein n=1 Tax=Austropuccinia psidii MF-1 TaxID=1389203 RepID=A0A9Q3BKP5_9BASI|nr:hypothetical protein [Austropuccinia psidii MF-1]